MRGDVHQPRAPRDARGDEQRGARVAVVVQSDDLLLSTLLVAPTSRSAQFRRFRPSVTIEDVQTHVLVEQAIAVTPERLSDFLECVSR